MDQSIIQSLFDENVKLPPDDSVYQDLMRRNDFLTIGATVYSLLKKHNKLHLTPEFFQNKLKEIYTDTFYKNIFIKNQTKQLLNEFENQRIEVIPLKGPLFTEKYFGDIGARFSSDIDLLIRKKDLDKAAACIRKLGFSNEKIEVPSHFNRGFYKELPDSPCPLAVELHWNLVDEHTSNINLEVIWKDSEAYQSRYTYVKELSDYHTFYMIVLHGWRHNLDSLKYDFDIIQMITVLSNSLVFERLIADAEIQLTKRRLIRTLSILYKRYPFLTSVKTFPNLIHKKAAAIPEEKTFKRYAAFLDYQFLSYDSFGHRMRELKLWFFPSKKEISFLLGRKSGSSLFDNYVILYKKRLFTILKVFWP
ncbi:nucleotidyltransferase family protein [Fictibacillus barbaricus]|uniref:Nucleotidyltransferase-like protein n=1 Tax=Fictibacillus barbaricus TaxID=182136 RepID=A0ABU1U1L0_9BACL|nr:nucleotidyltransferase family protein [Fictibacillus barbaricus]MDR7073349.1 hypothetical protein [Fictibacillus barbaricus]